MSKNYINGSRHMFSCAEGKGDLSRYLVPFKRLRTERFDLWNLDPNEWPQIVWRLLCETKRLMIPIITVATGWKGRRAEHTAWHPQHNKGVAITTKDGVRKTIHMHDDFKRWMTDKDSITIYDGVCDMLYEAMQDVGEFIMYWVNEPMAYDIRHLYPWYDGRFRQWEGRVPCDHLAFEKMDSGKMEDLLTDYEGVWCFAHGYTTFWEVQRYHKGEMGWYHDEFKNVCIESDGSGEKIGEGLIGTTWNDSFRRMTPVEIAESMVHDYKQNGAGFVNLSAVTHFEHALGAYSSLLKGGVHGLSKVECQKHGVDWMKFSYVNKDGVRVPLPEFLAFKRAMNRIHK